MGRGTILIVAVVGLGVAAFLLLRSKAGAFLEPQKMPPSDQDVVPPPPVYIPPSGGGGGTSILPLDPALRNALRQMDGNNPPEDAPTTRFELTTEQRAAFSGVALSPVKTPTQPTPITTEQRRLLSGV